MSGFFDMHQQLNRRPSRTAAPSSASSDEAYTPSQVNRLVEGAIKGALPASLLVRGEVSNFNRNRTSGHCYFTLKDSAGCIDAVMWASRAERLRFDPRDGMELLARGSVGVYVPRGKYQLVVDSLEPVGEGALELAKRQLLERLRGEGLLDAERKRPIPAFPRSIAIVSSPQAAGFADVLKVLRRHPWLRLRVFPVPVQGRDAAPAIASALRCLGSGRGDCGGIDLILVCRGGGSLEDLWAFNDEAVCRAIAASSIPVITGVGHDVDVSVADLVADHHAHTPTEAATFATRNWRIAPDVVEGLALRASRELRRRFEDARLRVASVVRHELFRRPASMLDDARQRVDDAGHDLSLALERRLAQASRRLDRIAAGLSPRLIEANRRASADRVERLAGELARAGRRRLLAPTRAVDALDARLRGLAPDRVLARGYSITTLKRSGTIVRSAAQVRGGDTIVTRLADGTIESTARDPKQPDLF